ncbi:MAG: 3-deoxy-D-manno-octulosonic acid transferase, partial [Melioribacteraceae bacterium]|nr:3-deoxy-D-manno-octulosonic acid transferase [Melioribacteraceae bacterium]
MKKHWFILYNISVVPLIYISLTIASFFNSKIKRGMKNRSSLFENLKEKINLIDRSKKLIWFHSASLGEFEQAKPIIKKLYHEKEISIIVTFFSPSGY